MIDEPSAKVLREADLKAISALYWEARRLEVAGKLTKSAFASMWKRGLVAAKGDTALLQTLAMFKP